MTTASSLTSLLLNPGTGVLIGLLVVAAWIDWRTMRIPNWLTVAGMVFGFFWNAATAQTWFEGLALAGGGLAVGLCLFLPFWLVRVMGAGDVKLMAMVGAFLGPWATVKAALFVGIVGGLAVIVFAIRLRAIRRLAVNTRDIATSMLIPGMPMWRPELVGTSLGKLPYGVSIGAGTCAFLVLRQVGLG